MRCGILLAIDVGDVPSVPCGVVYQQHEPDSVLGVLGWVVHNRREVAVHGVCGWRVHASNKHELHGVPHGQLQSVVVASVVHGMHQGIVHG